MAIVCLDAMMHTFMEYQRVWAAALPLFRQDNNRAANTKPRFKTWGRCIQSAPSYWETGYTLENKELTDAPSAPQSWQHLLCCRERDTDGTKQPWAHRRHSPSTLTVGKCILEEKCQDVRCAGFSLHTGLPSVVKLTSQHTAHASLSSSCSSWCQAATKGSKGVYLPIMEEGGYRMFPVLKQSQTNHSFLRVCPGNMYFCVWGWRQFQKVTTFSA